MNPLYKLMLFGCLLVVALALLLPGPAGETQPNRRQDEAATKSLSLYCAASLRAPIEIICQRYQEEQGVAVDIQYGGSSTLLSQIEVAGHGDLFIAADESYLKLGAEKGLLSETRTLTTLSPVVVVARGGPIRADTLDDLLRLRLSAANPEQAAIGRLVRASLDELGRWSEFDEAVRGRGVYKPTVTEVANDVALGAVEAGIIWDAVARQYDNLEVIRLPELAGAESAVGVGVLTSASDPAEAARFVNYLGSEDGGIAVLKAEGYSVVVGSDYDALEPH